MKRLFIAIKLNSSEKLTMLLEEFKYELRSDKIKWVDPAHLHLTLAFLGQTDEKLIPDLSKYLSIVTSQSNSFNLMIEGCGVFKSIRNPTAIWLSIKTDPALLNVKTLIDAKLEQLGFTLEKREFRPHLTIGRPKSIQNSQPLVNLLEKYKNQFILKQEVNEIILFESQLHPKGPIYKEASIHNLYALISHR